MIFMSYLLDHPKLVGSNFGLLHNSWVVGLIVGLSQQKVFAKAHLKCVAHTFDIVL